MVSRKFRLILVMGIIYLIFLNTFALPVVAGGSVVVRGPSKVSKVDDVAKVVSKGEKIGDVGKVSAKTAERAVADESRLQHAYKHAGELRLGFTGKSWKTEREAFTQLNKKIINSPDKTFTKALRGGEGVTGYYKKVEGKDIIVYIYNKGKDAGKVATTYKLSPRQVEQLKRYGGL